MKLTIHRYEARAACLRQQSYVLAESLRYKDRILKRRHKFRLRMLSSTNTVIRYLCDTI